ncbi:myosin-2 heavy chain [Culicoides brevitarsis]|uniref:myosin-2 heavy chain n=1 Tax=Culicoides brevitarsis TaxID=469753 RepID=UPI00307BCF62
MDIDLYDDLDVIPNKFEQEKKDLEQKYEKVRKDYDQVKRELDDLRSKYDAANKNETSLKTLKANFDSLLLTAQAEIDRLKRQIEIARKEKDDVVFRRTRPQARSVRESWTQTDFVRKVNYGVQTDVERQSERNRDRRELDRVKRLRSRSREKTSRSSSKHSGSENERKRARHDDQRRENARRDRRKSSERSKIREKEETRTVVTRKSTRLSEEKREKEVELKKSEIKEASKKAKRKSKTPRKESKKKVDPVEEELQILMSEPSSNDAAENKNSNFKLDTTQDLRKLLESKKGTQNATKINGSEDKKIIQESKETEKKVQTKEIIQTVEVKLPKKSPLELLWQERQVETVPDESQNTSELFGSLSSLSLSSKASEKCQKQFNDLYSDSESALSQQKSKENPLKTVSSGDLEDGEIVDDEKSNEKPKVVEQKVIVKEEKVVEKVDEKRKSPEKNISVAKTRKMDKKSVSKIVPGTVDDSACDLGEIIKKQTSLVQKTEAPKENSASKDVKNELETEKVAVTKVPETKEAKSASGRLIELSDLCENAAPLEKKSSSPTPLISQKSMESIIMSNQDLFNDQSNISLLIAADIFLQNENTMKSSEKLQEIPSTTSLQTTISKSPVVESTSESNFNGFSSQEMPKSPRNNSNDSLKENICTPVANQAHNVLHSHGATPKTMTKSEPKQLLTQLNNGPDSSVPTPDTSKDVTGELVINTTENTSKAEDSLNSSAKRRIIETKSTQYVVEETEEMVICTVTRKKRKKEKKEKKSKHKHKHKERTSFEEKM